MAAPVFAQPSLPPASTVVNEPVSRGGLLFQDRPATGAATKDIPRQEPVQTRPSASKPVAAPAECAFAAITCIEIASTSNQQQAKVPVTFGQPFRIGDWKHQATGLVAKDNLGNAVALQFDQISSHVDGSARFAVLSTEVPNLKPQERRVVSIFSGKEQKKATANTSATSPSYRMDATFYHPQVTRVQFGNRNGHTPGIAFAEGEQITLTLSGPATERYSIALTAAQAGGSHTTLTKISDSFMRAINSHSKIYSAEIRYENVWIRARTPEGGAFQAKVDYSGPAKTQITNEKTFKKPEVWTAQTSDSKEKSHAVNSLRLQGPVVSEAQQVLPFRSATTGAEHPHLVARLDSRTYQGSGAVWTDAVFENNWTFKKDPGNLQYEIAIYENGKLVHHQPPFTHYHHARWHKVFWSGTVPSIEVRHHMPYFMSSAAVWNYDLSLVVPEKVLEAEASLLEKRQQEQQALGPMKNVLMEPSFPGTGGRSEIAPVPRWTALYLVTQDPRAYASMMANADAAAAVPIHYRDEQTEQPVEPLKHPDLTVYGGGNIPSTSDRTIWSPDTAHQGSFTYVPYLMTGNRFYLDEMMFWATWNIISFPADYRGKEKALINMQQVRGQAWVFRSLAEVDRSLADNHAMKAAFKKILKNNLSFYKNHYIDESKGSPLGFVAHSQTEMSSWQNDFMVTVLALMAENKEPQAKELHAWFSRFSVGRFLADDEGFCAARASGYYWKTANSAGKPFTRWSEIYNENYPQDAGKPCSSLVITGGYPDSPGGYVAYARGMLGASANAGYKNAAEAYSKWKSMTPKLEQAFSIDPSWAIVPR